jgi:hypothetical protein
MEKASRFRFAQAWAHPRLCIGSAHKKTTRSEMTGSSRIVCKIGGLRQARYQTILACLDDLTDNVANYTKWKCYYCPDEVGGRPKHARMPGFLRGGCGLSSLHRLGRAGAFRGARPLVA